MATGIMVGAVTTLGVWAVGLPFGALELWWGRRYGLERSGYAEWAFEQWPALLAQVVGLTIALTVLLLLAGRFGRRWWLAAAPLFVVGGVLLVFVLPWLETLGTRPPHDTPAAARIRQLARDEGVGGTPVRIEDVHDQTTAANAMATGIGPSARVFIWDTFLDGRYSNREIEVVAAHEFGHIAHHHIWKGLAWSAAADGAGLLAGGAGDAPPRRARAPGGRAPCAARTGADRPPDHAAREYRLAPLRSRGRLVGVARDPRPGGGGERLPQVQPRRPGAAEPAALVVHLDRQPPDGRAADRDGPRLRGPPRHAAVPT